MERELRSDLDRVNEFSVQDGDIYQMMMEMMDKDSENARVIEVKDFNVQQARDYVAFLCEGTDLAWLILSAA